MTDPHDHRLGQALRDLPSPTASDAFWDHIESELGTIQLRQRADRAPAPTDPARDEVPAVSPEPEEGTRLTLSSLAPNLTYPSSYFSGTPVALADGAWIFAPESTTNSAHALLGAEVKIESVSEAEGGGTERAVVVLSTKADQQPALYTMYLVVRSADSEVSVTEPVDLGVGMGSFNPVFTSDKVQISFVDNTGGTQNRTYSTTGAELVRTDLPEWLGQPYPSPDSDCWYIDGEDVVQKFSLLGALELVACDPSKVGEFMTDEQVVGGEMYDGLLVIGLGVDGLGPDGYRNEDIMDRMANATLASSWSETGELVLTDGSWTSEPTDGSAPTTVRLAGGGGGTISGSTGYWIVTVEVESVDANKSVDLYLVTAVDPTHFEVGDPLRVSQPVSLGKVETLTGHTLDTTKYRVGFTDNRGTFQSWSFDIVDAELVRSNPP